MLSTEFLDLTYELRYYPPLIDVLGTITLDGVVYDTTLRAASVTNADYWGSIIGSQIAGINNTAGNVWLGLSAVFCSRAIGGVIWAISSTSPPPTTPMKIPDAPFSMFDGRQSKP